jgi:hypothetical protein
MIYDWEDTLRLAPGSRGWFEEIDRRSLSAAYFAKGKDGGPFGRFMMPEYRQGGSAYPTLEEHERLCKLSSSQRCNAIRSFGKLSAESVPKYEIGRSRRLGDKTSVPCQCLRTSSGSI